MKTETMQKQSFKNLQETNTKRILRKLNDDKFEALLKLQIKERKDKKC